ncbi:MAG TPA: Mur ligase family protein [Polyangia bacterium]|nr:Mur ligase family protein [Polyangia bacterium]
MSSPRYADLLARLRGAQSLGVDLGLEPVRRALALLGDPQRKFAAVQIAGTNGKGSTAAMTEAILRGAGLRTGLYTSPHLARFTERIRVAGREVDGDRLADLDRRLEATGVRLTYFEIATVLGFLALAVEAVEIAVLETGLGGRLDAVTTCEPLATAITSIDLDHTEYLGHTLREIAAEKAGILKPGVPCFLGRLPTEAEEAIAVVATRVGAPLLRLGRDFAAPAGSLGLPGAHQRDNAALAIALADTAAAAVGRPADPTTIDGALAGVAWPGRLERVGDDLLFDCAHNAHGARALAAALPELSRGRRVALLVSIARDKDAGAIFAALAPVAHALVATRSESLRAVPPETLAVAARDYFAEVAAHDDVPPALAAARRLAGPGGLVVVCGSMFLVGTLRARLLGEPVDALTTSDPVAVDRSAAGSPNAAATSPRR